MNLKKFEKSNKEDIHTLETQFNVKLPEDYKSFLLETGGGVAPIDESSQIYINDLDDRVSVGVLFGAKLENKLASVHFWMDEYKDEMFEQTILIGDSLEHGFFALICDGDNKGVYYWDDTYHFEDSNDENNIYRIADSFEEFLKLLEN